MSVVLVAVGSYGGYCGIVFFFIDSFYATNIALWGVLVTRLYRLVFRELGVVFSFFNDLVFIVVLIFYYKVTIFYFLD